MEFAGSHDGYAYRDLFNRGTLELTFKILRRQHPALALRVQNAIVTAYARDDYHTGLTADQLPIDPVVVRRIVAALSRLSDELVASRRPHKVDLVMVRSLLLDWLMFTRDRLDHPPAE